MVPRRRAGVTERCDRLTPPPLCPDTDRDPAVARCAVAMPLDSAAGAGLSGRLGWKCLHLLRRHRVFCPPVVDFSKARLPPLGRTLGQLSPPVTGGEAEPRSPVTQGPVLICGSLGPEPRKPLSQLPPIIGPVSPTFGRGAVLGLPRPQLQLWASS